MRKVVCIMGATASGKTGLSIRLAKRFGGEIISSDSMQIYRGMDIGTAKPDLAERDGVPHHMLDILDPGEDFSAARYAELAGECVEEIMARGRMPIVAGGTGLYVDALLGARSFEEQPDTAAVRLRLQQEAEEKGCVWLYEKLRTVDPERAAKLHPNDEKRVIRALEIFETTGETATERDRRAAARPPRYDSVKIGLDWPDRAALYARIDLRVELMLQEGLLEEAARVRAMQPGRTALQAIGYKELFRYFDGQCSLEEAKEDIARESRRYAKRQLTWLRKDPDIHWLNAEDADALFASACRIIEQNY
ncbi:MAG: tRNA (adenosine(37)-N6)-dimethylallyltransferase MiaA [Ruminococcaceae bacterium]|nr:tRNA (adenosine(37)-N6)-dimethylallyltransferase MiaA [Oscillospiraceae bacterium]